MGNPTKQILNRSLTEIRRSKYNINDVINTEIERLENRLMVVKSLEQEYETYITEELHETKVDGYLLEMRTEIKFIVNFISQLKNITIIIY